VILIAVATSTGTRVAPIRADETEPSVTRQIVQSIEWRGNKTLTEGELRDHILTQSSRWPRFWVTYEFREEELREDMKRIAALYRLRGYYEVKAEYSLIFDSDPSEDSSGERADGVDRSEGLGEDPNEAAASSVAISIRIDEGVPARTRSIRIRFEDDSDPSTHPLIDRKPWKERVASLPLRKDQPFELEHYRGSGQKLRAYLAELGFPQARLIGGAEVDLVEHSVAVNWVLDLGPRIEIGEIEIEGLEDVAEAIVRREISFEPGQWYSLSAMALTRQRLQNLSLFRWTVVELDVPEDPASSLQAEAVWPVRVRLSEGSPRRVRLGGGWGTDTSYRAEISWHHRDFFGGARHSDVTARYSDQATVLRPAFMEPYLFGTPTQLLVTPAVAFETRDAYSARRILIDVELRRELIAPWSVRAGYSVDRSDVYSVSDDPGESDLPEGISIDTGPHLAIRRSTVKNPLNSRSGSFAELAAESSLSAFGSDEDFIRYTLDVRSFAEAFSTVVAGRLLLGSIQNLSNTKDIDIPLVERFYSGGSSSMRGFGFRALSPKDFDGDSIGGSSLIEASVEWRVPLFQSLGAVAFVDAAFVGVDSFNWRFSKLRYAAGPGLRYDTPAGPIRLDLAWRLNPDRSRGKFRVNASLGHTF
jgi:outer membrane protein assembly complex protein YaeT